MEPSAVCKGGEQRGLKTCSIVFCVVLHYFVVTFVKPAVDLSAFKTLLTSSAVNMSCYYLADVTEPLMQT